jgi:hypothetical protein
MSVNVFSGFNSFANLAVSVTMYLSGVLIHEIGILYGNYPVSSVTKVSDPLLMSSPDASMSALPFSKEFSE